MKFADYLRDTKGEMKHVTWPGRKQVAMYTVAVIAISLILAVFLGAFDILFQMGIARLFS